jgi:hypothetical protein
MQKILEYCIPSSLPPFNERRHKIFGVSAEIRTLTSQIQVEPYRRSCYGRYFRCISLCVVTNVFHNRKRHFWHCLSSQAKHPATFWRLYCLRLQVERQKGEPTLVSQLERAHRNLFVAFSIPNKDGGSSNLRNGARFSARDDGHSRQGPTFFVTMTICTILWSWMKLLVNWGLLSTGMWRRIARWTYNHSEVYCSNCQGIILPWSLG